MRSFILDLGIEISLGEEIKGDFLMFRMLRDEHEVGGVMSDDVMRMIDQRLLRGSAGAGLV